MPEVFTSLFTTSLTSAISTTARPVTLNVAATTAALGVTDATYSVLVYDVGWDGQQSTSGAHHVEALKITSGGASLGWVGETESGWIPQLHDSGSVVIATILTPRSVQQQMIDHVAASNPHSAYIRKSEITGKGVVLVGTASGYTPLSPGANGTTPLADDSQPSGWRWGTPPSVVSQVQHVGDLVSMLTAGVPTRIPIGVERQQLRVVIGAPAFSDPSLAPTLSAGTSGSLSNGVAYDFAYAWSNGTPPDGGISAVSPRATFTATSSGSVNIQAPSAPDVGLTLIVYGALQGGNLQQQATLPSASHFSSNFIDVNAINSGASPQTINTTGGLVPTWSGPVVQAALSATASISTAPIAQVAVQALLAATAAVATGRPGFIESYSAPAIANSDTITTAGLTTTRVDPASAVTGIVLQAGTYAAQPVTVINEAAAVNTVTFAASGTSNVADGVGAVIAGLTACDFVWNSVRLLWYRKP